MLKYTKRLIRKIKTWMAYNPPWALTGPGWNAFNKEFREKAPIRYWIHHDYRKIFVYPIKRKYEAISNWIRYRTYDRYHVVKTGLEPGYYDVDTTMLNVNFSLLKDFVEVETASRQFWSSDEKRSWQFKYIPFYRTFVPFRRPDLGIVQLEWASTLDDPTLPPYEQSVHQAVSAREILALYKWWVNERPARNPIDLVRPRIRDDDMDDLFVSDEETPEYKKWTEAIESSQKQQEEWDEEDTNMLVRLVKIRRSLWT
jgi:hypothetical protein